MKYFRCFDCRHIWKIVFWEDGKGANMAFPECKGLNVHRMKKLQGWDRERKDTTLVTENDQKPTSPRFESVRRVLLKKEY